MRPRFHDHQPICPHAINRLAAGFAVAIALLAGCQSPLDRDAEQDLRNSVRASVDRELNAVPATEPRETESYADSLPEELASRRSELDTLGPQVTRDGVALEVGPGLDGTTLPVFTLSLEHALHSAVTNNLGVQQTRIQQDIAAAEIVRAEAVFDAVLGAGTSFARIDEPSPNLVFDPAGPFPPGTLPSQNQDLRQWGFTSDLSKRMSSGGLFSVGFESENQSYFTQAGRPETAWNSNVSLGLSQPLLRGFGSEVNTADIRLARNNDRRSTVQLRSDLLDLLVDVESAYWSLVLARQQLVVAEWLVSEGERIRDILDSRRGFDTTLAQYADAVATVESRKTRVIEAVKAIGDAAGRLKLLMNDPALPVGGEVNLVPADLMADQPVVYDLRDSVTTALGRSPLIDFAVLSIDDASIQEIVARNGRLPQLDIAAEVSWLGLAGSLGSSMGNINGDFVDYVLGLQFTQALGNRAADSVFIQARLQRSAAVISYRQAVQGVVLQVKDAIRDMRAGYALIAQARNFRLAQAENLRALEALQRTLAALTPEFLNLLFQRQERLAEAQLQESNALVRYNIAVAQLERATGTGLEANNIDLVVVESAGENAEQ
ncbi:MAG: TolC family protein [Phycisphaerales bacterium]|nr:TolC family protein [Phycisphaerales bacterium]